MEISFLARSSYCGMENRPDESAACAGAPARGGPTGAVQGACPRTPVVVALPAASASEVSAWRRVTRSGIGGTCKNTTQVIGRRRYLRVRPCRIWSCRGVSGYTRLSRLSASCLPGVLRHHDEKPD